MNVLVGVVIFGFIAITIGLAIACDYRDRSSRRKRELSDKRKEQRRKRRTSAVINQAIVDEIVDHINKGDLV